MVMAWRRWCGGCEDDGLGGVMMMVTMIRGDGGSGSDDGGDSSWGDGGVRWWWRPQKGGGWCCRGMEIEVLPVIGAAKVSHFEIMCRAHGFEPIVGLFRCFYVNSKNKGWMSFSKRQEMDLLSFIRTANPTKVRIGERHRAKDEPKLLDTTIGRVVLLLPIAPARAESELDASVDKLFDESGSGNQAELGDSASGGHGAGIQLVSEAAETIVEDATPMQPKRQKKRKTMIVDADEPSHPAKRLRDDHGTPGGPVVSGKSRSLVQRLLAEAVQNVEVMGGAMPTLPFVTSSVYTTPEHEGGDHTESLAETDLHIIGALQRFNISSDSSHYSSVNVAEAEVDSVVRTSVPIMTSVTTTTPTANPVVIAKEKLVGSSVFGADSSSAGGSHPIPGGFSDSNGSEFLIGGIRIVIDPDSNLQKVYVPQWNVTNGSHLDDGDVCREMVDEFAPPKFFASVRGMEHDKLFTEFNVGAVRQMYLSAEVRMHAEYNIKEKRRLKSVVDEQTELLKVREKEIESLKAQLLVKEAEAAEAIRLRAEASKFEVVERSLLDEAQVLKECNTTLEKEKSELEIKVADLATSVKVREQEVADLDVVVTSVKSRNDSLVDQVHGLETSSAGLQEKVTAYESCIDQLEKFQDDKMKEVNGKFDQLYTDFIEMTLHLEDKFYPHLLTTIFGHRWLFTHGMGLAFAKCLNSTEYISTIGATIGKVVEKGMHDGLSAGITHGVKGRNLTDVAAYNPSAEADYISALQRLQSVNFSLVAELRSNKDASVETIIYLLRLDDTLAEKLGLTESQPHVNQLMVPIHRSPDQTVVALRDVFIPLAERFSAVALEGTGGTSETVPATIDTTTALSTTLASVSSIIPISVDDYDVAGTDDQEAVNENVASDNATGEDVNPFPNVDEAELNVPE
ncbi:hypothetical protein Tco_0174163 [Tanacetum coccineum]